MLLLDFFFGLSFRIPKWYHTLYYKCIAIYTHHLEQNIIISSNGQHIATISHVISVHIMCKLLMLVRYVSMYLYTYWLHVDKCVNSSIMCNHSVLIMSTRSIGNIISFVYGFLECQFLMCDLKFYDALHGTIRYGNIMSYDFKFKIDLKNIFSN